MIFLIISIISKSRGEIVLGVLLNLGGKSSELTLGLFAPSSENRGFLLSTHHLQPECLTKCSLPSERSPSKSSSDRVDEVGSG